MSQKKRRKKIEIEEEEIFAETTEEFRIRFIETIQFTSRDWKKVFKDSRIGKRIPNNEKPIMIINFLLDHESRDLRLNFENASLDKLDEDTSFTDRFKSFLSTIELTDCNRKSLITVLDKFFSSKHSNTKGYVELRRKEESIVMENLSRLTHAKLCGILIPVDVVLEIMKFLESNYELICSLGCVNEKWFRIVLQSWKRVRIWYNFMSIPKLVLQNVKYIEFVRKENPLSPGKRDEYMIRRSSRSTARKKAVRDDLLDLEYVLCQVNSQSILGLDFSDLDVPKYDNDFYKPLEKSKLVIDFPHLEFIGLPIQPVKNNNNRSRNITNFLELKNLRNLTSLKCDVFELSDFKECYERLRSLTLLIRMDSEKELQKFSNTKDFLLPLVEEFSVELFCESRWRSRYHEVEPISVPLNKFLLKIPSCRKYKLSHDVDKSKTSTVVVDVDMSKTKIQNLHLEEGVRAYRLYLPKSHLQTILLEYKHKRQSLWAWASGINLGQQEIVKDIYLSTSSSVKNLYFDFFCPLMITVDPTSFNDSLFYVSGTNEMVIKSIDLMFEDDGVRSKVSDLVNVENMLLSYYCDDELFLDIALCYKKEKAIKIRIFSDTLFGYEDLFDDNDMVYDTTYINETLIRNKGKKKKKQKFVYPNLKERLRSECEIVYTSLMDTLTHIKRSTFFQDFEMTICSQRKEELKSCGFEKCGATKEMKEENLNFMYIQKK